MSFLCKEFNKLTNTSKIEEQLSTVPYHWLAEDDHKRNLTHKEMLEKYVDLELASHLTQKEKEELKDKLYRYKEAVSIRKEIGTCSNIEVEQNVVEKTPYFIRPYHVKKEDRQILDKEMKRLCHMGISKECFFQQNQLHLYW